MFKRIAAFFSGTQDTTERLFPDGKSAADWFAQSTKYAESHEWDDALRCMGHALRLEPESVNYRLGMAEILCVVRNFEDVVTLLKEVWALGESVRDEWPRLADLALRSHDFRLARSIAEKLQSPYENGTVPCPQERVAGLMTVGQVAAKEGDWDTALANYSEAMALDPNDSQIPNELGAVYSALGRWNDAERYFGLAHELCPESFAATCNLGLIKEKQARHAEALGFYEAAARINPHSTDVQINLALARLRLGDLSRGFAGYEVRTRVPAWFGLCPVLDETMLWDGCDIRGKDLLVVREQGFGDQIQFARYLPLLAKRGVRTHFMCSPELVQIFSSLPYNPHIYPDNGPPPPHDAQCLLMSLPHLFGTTLDTIPAQVPYLTASTEKRAFWRQRLGKRTKSRVGLVWSSNHPYVPSLAKRIPFEVIGYLFEISECQFYSLQKDRLQDEVLPNAVIDIADELRDFSDTAAVLEELDLVITVDTAVAHLAGAIGRPVWTLLKPDACWRWLIDRDDSPWYPSMTLIRQGNSESWDDVLRRVAEKLTESYRS